MTTRQRVQLAHFVVTQAGESDPRVGDHRAGYPVDVSLMSRDGVQHFTQDKLQEYVKGSTRIFGEIRKVFT